MPGGRSYSLAQQIIDRREDDLLRAKDNNIFARNPMMKKAKKVSSAKRGKQVRKSAKATHEHKDDVQACGCDFDAADMKGTPDADLPAAKGGVASGPNVAKSARRIGAARMSR